MKKVLSELRKIAESATPGPWEVWKNVHCDPVVVPAGKPWAGITDPKMPFEKIAGLSTAPDDYGRANLEYIATFDPETVLALLSRLEEAEQAASTLEQDRDYWKASALDSEQVVDRVREVAAGWATNDRPFRAALLRALDGEQS